MSRTLTTSQNAAVDSNSTRPIFVVQINHSGTIEYLSSSGEVTFDGLPYVPGIKVSSIQDASAASLELPWSTARVAEIQNGAWRGGICKVWAIPALPDEATPVYDLADGILMLDGQIRASSFSGNRVSIQAAHVSAISKISPRYTYDAVCNHIPPAGTQIVWEGEILTLESRR